MVRGEPQLERMEGMVGKGPAVGTWLNVESFSDYIGFLFIGKQVDGLGKIRFNLTPGKSLNVRFE